MTLVTDLVVGASQADVRVVDLTLGYSANMPSYPANWYPKSGMERAMTPETDPAGTGRTFTHLHLFPHNATHAESAFHFFHDRETLDQVPLERFIGRACVADLSAKGLREPIGADDLDRAVGDIWHPGDRLLVRTDYVDEHWGEASYWDDPPYLTAGAADWMVENGATLVGVDCLTDLPADETSPVHRRLLQAGIPILEYLANLRSLRSREAWLFAVPLKIHGTEAAPVRAIALEARP